MTCAARTLVYEDCPRNIDVKIGLARYQCPDIMIAASSPEAILQDYYLCVRGELHIGCNTLGAPLFTAQHPTPEALSLVAEIDLLEPIIVPVISKASTLLTSARLMPGPVKPKGYYIQLEPDPPEAPNANVLPLGVVVEREGDDLVVRTVDGKFRFGIIDMITEFFGLTVTSCFHLIATHKHTPASR